jgi:hypothetical protein
MSDVQKPFTLYRMGPGIIRVVPRTAQGWWYSLGWSALWLVVFAGYVAFTLTGPDQPSFLLASALFAVLTLGIGFGSMAWMGARAEVVDLSGPRAD